MTGAETLFELAGLSAAKADPRLVRQDAQRLALVAEAVAAQEAALSAELDELRRSPGGSGRAALDRDLAIHRLSGRLGTLQRFGRDLCLGKIVPADGSPATYIGRLGVSDRQGDPLLVDWRTPAAEPFFAATSGHPMGLASRRRFRWASGRIVDYWDDAFVPLPPDAEVALDDDSAFIASLGASREPKLRSVLATVQADQDAVIRAGSEGALVVDGGPGTGKTVVALHRAAYLLYADPRLQGSRGGVLFVGPHESYLNYVADVLPSLGEDGVRTCTLRDLVEEGAAAVDEPDAQVARLKASADLARAVGPAVALYEEAPTGPVTIETDWGDIALLPKDWCEAFETVDPGTGHNEARDDIWEALVEIAADNGPGEDEVPRETLRRAIAADHDFRATFGRTWPVLKPTDLVADLWAVPAYLRRCAPWLDDEQRRVLRRREGSAWTVSDLPLLDAMRARLGDPGASRRRREHEAAMAADRDYMDDVVHSLLEADDDPESPLPLLNRDSLRTALLHDDEAPGTGRDGLAGPFAHVIVDEAQELTDAEWQILLRRCPARSFTIVGDRAQARHGFPDSWQERVARVGFRSVRQASLTVNYRTPREVMAAAEPVIRAVLPDANVPTSIRGGGEPVRYGSVDELDAVVAGWLTENPEGTACVIGTGPVAAAVSGRDRSRVSALDPVGVKGLEFDLVVIVDPASFGEGVEAAVDRYVAMTRTTGRLVILSR